MSFAPPIKSLNLNITEEVATHRMSSKKNINFNTIEEVATHLRQELEDKDKSKKTILLFAYNGIGKTRLSMEFKEQGKKNNEHDTLYFNAFTEDLFTWDNDLDNDVDRKLKLNKDSIFFKDIKKFVIESHIRRFLNSYADFDFKIIYTNNKIGTGDYELEVRFSRKVYTKDSSKTVENIKISRGEENIFIWCFFLAIAQLAIDGEGTYKWVKYIYIDDPISSLDDNNAIAVACDLVQLLNSPDSKIKTVISSHHTLFFNVLYNELRAVKSNRTNYFLSKNKNIETYTLKDTSDTPFFYHVAMLAELHEAVQTGNLYTHHFNILRIILEKTASFLGYRGFSHCIKKDKNDRDGMMHTRMINLLSHGNYSLYEPKEMVQDNKDIFKKILNNFLQKYGFNTEALRELAETQEDA